MEGEEKPKKKPRWVAGKEMPLFSGKTWKELEDIWPKSQRVSSEAAFIVGVFGPALLATMKFMKTNYGYSITKEEFFTLCWIHRCEEGREGVATASWPAMKGLNVGGTLWPLRKGNITRLGLIENMPSSYITLYRVTATGKMLIKIFVENVDKAHKDLRMWIADQGPDPEFRDEKTTRNILLMTQGEK